MDRTKAIELLRNAVPAKALPDDEIGFFIEAVSMAIAALDKDTNVPSNSALDHIHNVVRDDAYKRGYEQGFKDVSDTNVGKWIPVTPETLPEEGRSVLITKEPLKIQGYKQEVIKAKRSVDPRSGKIEWWSPEFGTLADKTVLAWMPLPEPWKGE